MKKNLVVAGLLSAVLCAPLAACGGSGSSTTTDTGSATTTETTESSSEEGILSEEEAVGQWRGSVEITGETIYGTAGGNEQMLDVYLNDDGTCSVEPLEAHADLLSDTGTWTISGDTITMTLDGGETIDLTVVDAATLTANAADFDIADFDTITFDFYG